LHRNETVAPIFCDLPDVDELGIDEFRPSRIIFICDG
jgi:hypothetical protein